MSTDEEYIRGPLREQARSLLESWRLRADRSYLLRYEELVLDTRATLTRLLTDLEIDASSEVVDAMIAGAPERRGGHETATSAEASVGRWREDLRESQRRVFEQEFGDVLEAFGYADGDGR